MNVTQAATPPAKWITHGYFVIELQTVKLHRRRKRGGGGGGGGGPGGKGGGGQAPQ